MGSMKLPTVFGEIVSEVWKQLRHIEDWWNDHNSGTRTWDNMNATNSTITNLTATNITSPSSFGTPVIATGTTRTLSTSSTFTATVITVSITPSSVSKRVLIQACFSLQTADLNSTFAEVSLARGSTNIGGTEGLVMLSSSDLDAAFQAPCSICFIDSPATTSATSYTVIIRSSSNTHTVSVNFETATWTIIAVEIP